MIGSFGAIYPGSWAALVVALDAALKATALIVLALAVHAMLGRRRALARSALWNGSLVGLLLLAAASPAFPRLRIVIPLAPKAPDPAESWPAVENGSLAGAGPIHRDPLLSSTAGPDESTTSGPSPVLRAPVGPAAAPASASALVSRSRVGMPFDVAGLVLCLYLVIAAGLLVRLAASMAAVGRLLHHCTPVIEPRWLRARDRWRTRLGIVPPVALRESHGGEVSVPIVVGWLRPSIVLPNRLVGAARPELIDAVLLHELGHVRRGDFAWNVVCKLVQIVYWPHPLIWLVGRIVATLREQACDDLCVYTLGGAASYRASLVEVASGLVRRPGPSVGLAMARGTSLGRRLVWIDRSRGAARCLLRWPARLALAATVLVLAGLLGSMELARSTIKAAEKPSEPQANAPDPPKRAETNFDPEGPKAVEVTVRAKDTGQPLVGARVRAYLDHRFDLLRTDQQGKARIDRTHRTFGDSLSVDIWADGYIQQRYFFAQHDARFPKIPAQVTFELLPGEQTLGGRVTDEAGRPIAGVKVEIWGYLGEKKDPHELGYMVDTLTDDRGQWRCRCFRNMKFAYLYLSHPEYLSDGSDHPRRHGSPSPGGRAQPDERPLEALRDFTDVQVMTRGVEVSGRVVDQRGQPVVGAEVGWLGTDQRDTFHSDMPTTTTDVQGRFRFPHVRPGGLALQVKARGHAPELKTVVAKDGMEPVVLELGPPRTLSGRVVDSKGKPISDVFVNIDTWRGHRALGVFLKTDAEGRFRWEDAPPETILIGAGSAGYDGIFQHPVSPDDDAIVLTLKRSLSISGRIRDARTSEPIDRAEVEVGILDPDTGAVTWSRNLTAYASQGYLQAGLDADAVRKYRLRIKARGYEPFESRTFRTEEGQVEYDINLVKATQPQGDAIVGLVRRPDETPLVGAEVALTYPMAGGPDRLPSIQIQDGKIQPDGELPTTKTDTAGRFSLTREPDPLGQHFAVVVVHPEFYAEVTRPELEANSTMVARPWGRIEGFARIGSQPAAGSTIRYFSDRLGNADVPQISDSGQTRADERGRFVLERVVPGDVRLGGTVGEGSDRRAWANGQLVEVRSGEVVQVKLGGRGRPVVAKIVRPAGFDPKADYSTYSEFEIESDRPNIPSPKELWARRDGSIITWAKHWWASAEGHEYRRNWYRFGQAKLQPDGTIRVEDVPPGEYRLRLSFSADLIYGRGAAPERIALATKQFTIPEVPDGRSDQPFDLGVLRPKPRQALKIGQPAPPFEIETLDGRRLKLEDFRGRNLLLVFWATWCGPCITELPELKAVHDRFSADEGFAMLSLSLDADKEALRAFVAEQRLPWTQGFLGDWPEGGVQDAYHVEAIPSIFLIGPDGRLKAQILGTQAIDPVVASALAAP